MTALLLDSVGINNWKIIESSDRIGGRLYTDYLNNTTPEQHQYQEMGGMRFPVSWTKENGEVIEINDHKMVFQLGDELNKLNEYAEEFRVDFIPWVQKMENNFRDFNNVRLPDGTIPRVSDINKNSTLSATKMSSEASDASSKLTNMTSNESIVEMAAKNVFKAHKLAIELGYDNLSEFTLLQKYGYDLNVAEEVDSYDYINLWDQIYDESGYFGATDWRCIDKGSEHLPNAFHPLVDDRLVYNQRVDTITFNNDKVGLEWNDESNGDYNRKNDEFDYTFVSAPFSVVRSWNIPSTFTYISIHFYY